MTGDWARLLGARLKAGRILRGLEQQDVARELGKSRGAIANIEMGKVSTVSRTIRRYAELIGWADGSIDAVLAGGEPTLRGAPERPSPTESTPETDLPLRVAHALTRGRLIDSWVETVETPSGEIEVSTVVRLPPGATEEQVADALRAAEEQRQTRLAAEQVRDQGEL